MAYDPTATTAYAANRFAPRPSSGPVGRDMSAKQRDFVATLVTRSQDYMRRLVAATPVQGQVTQAMITDALAEFSTAATVNHIQAVLNTTSRTPRVLIDSLVASDKALAGRVRAIEARVPRTAAQQVTDIVDGATYRTPSGSVYHAYKGQSGRLLCKLWDATESVFSYYGAATRMPRDAVRLSTEQMQEFGQATGTCAVCMRHLTDDESVARGIGPVCWSKL